MLELVLLSLPEQAVNTRLKQIIIKIKLAVLLIFTSS